MAEDFNHLQQWLEPKIARSGLTVERLAQKARISKQQIYRYLLDHSRPNTQTMARICRVLGVSLEEALRQYTPKPTGRPRGSSGTTREVRVRQR